MKLSSQEIVVGMDNIVIQERAKSQHVLCVMEREHNASTEGVHWTHNRFWLEKEPRFQLSSNLLACPLSLAAQSLL